MKLSTLIPIILLVVTISGCVQSAPVIITVDSGKPAVVNVEPGTSTTININPPPTPVPTETPYPKPSYIPTLRPYKINKDHDIWHAQDPSSYITPNNEWVRYYASRLFVDYDGRIKYKDTKVLIYKGLTDSDVYGYAPFTNNYVYDWEQFGNGARGSIANDDYWVNPDYYLTHGMKGDCSEWGNAVASMMLSGKMSVWVDGILTQQVIPAKAFLGKMDTKKDEWAEYSVYGKTFITSTARETEAITGEQHSQTWFLDKNSSPLAKLYTPYFEFTDKYFKVV